MKRTGTKNKRACGDSNAKPTAASILARRCIIKESPCSFFFSFIGMKLLKNERTGIRYQNSRRNARQNKERDPVQNIPSAPRPPRFGGLFNF